MLHGIPVYVSAEKSYREKMEEFSS